MSYPTLILADDHSVIAEALKKLLSPKFVILGIASSGEALLQLVQEQKPDLILLDVSMPGMGGFEALKRLRKDGCAARVVVLSMHDEPSYAAQAKQLGADGFVPKTAPGDALIETLQRAVLGMPGFPDLETVNDPELPMEQAQEWLTPRQKEVLRCVALGKTAKEVAKELGISFRTAEGHKAIIMKQLGLRTTAELVRYAIRVGLIDPNA